MKFKIPMLLGLIFLGHVSLAATVVVKKSKPKTTNVRVQPVQKEVPPQIPPVDSTPVRLSENPLCEKMILQLSQRLSLSGYHFLNPELRVAQDRLSKLTQELSMRRTWGRSRTENQNLNGSMDTVQQYACYDLQKRCGTQLDQALESLNEDKFNTQEYSQLLKCHDKMVKEPHFGQVKYYNVDLAKKCAQKSEVLRKLNCLEFGKECTPKEKEVIQSDVTWDQVEKMKQSAQAEVDRLEMDLQTELKQFKLIQISDASFSDDRDWYTYTITKPGILKEIRKLRLLQKQVSSYLQSPASTNTNLLAFPKMILSCQISDIDWIHDIHPPVKSNSNDHGLQ